MTDTTKDTPAKGGTLRQDRAYARLLGDAEGVARLTKQIEEQDRREALSDEQRTKADELGAHLVNARRFLIAAQRVSDELGFTEAHMNGAHAIAAVDDAVSDVQGRMGGVR